VILNSSIKLAIVRWSAFIFTASRSPSVPCGIEPSFLASSKVRKDRILSQSMTLTLVFALLGSLILSLTFPAMMPFLLRGHVSEKESFMMRYARRRYRPALAKLTGNRRTTLVAAVALVVVSDAIFPSIRLFYLRSSVSYSVQEGVRQWRIAHGAS
jgi:hypothetical protein